MVGLAGVSVVASGDHHHLAAVFIFLRHARQLDCRTIQRVIGRTGRGSTDRGSAPRGFDDSIAQGCAPHPGREWQKLKYYLPKAIGCLILFFIPVIGQTVAPLAVALLCAWMAAIQYCDYPYDNHKIRFEIMRDDLKMSEAPT